MFASTEPLAGRIAVITGASRGLGGVLARAVHAAGARVAALARPSLALEKFAAEHPEMLVAPCDVSAPQDVRRAFDTVAARLGPPDILVNNAALCLLHRIEQATDEDAEREVATNLLGPLWCARAAIPHMRAAGRGDIVNVSSESVRRPAPFLSLYAATKAGLETLSEGLRSEVRGDGIRVTVLRSGSVAGGEISRNWTPERKAEFFEALQKTGFAAFTGEAISPETTAQTLVAILSTPKEANIDLIEVRAI
ncbi:MAG: SDR family oxidoreductase [Caulobacteraceae bacterium]|nr:SDR family oxidoreductase [Caulobacteraceae bacterium]